MSENPSRKRDQIEVVILTALSAETEAVVARISKNVFNRFGLNTHLPPDASQETLLTALQDQRWEFRAEAARRIAEAHRPLPEKSVLSTILHDPSPNVRAVAIRAFGARQWLSSDLLLNALKDQDWNLRSAVVEALGHFPEQAIADTLRRVAQTDRHSSVRATALMALKPLPVDLGVQALRDPEWQVREIAVRLLATQGEHAPTKFLLAALSDSHELVRTAAAQALEDLKGRVRQKENLQGTPLHAFAQATREGKKDQVPQVLPEENTFWIETLSENSWRMVYPQLLARARALVQLFHVESWQGREEDIAWDIVQESMRRAYEYPHKTAYRERVSVQSLTALLKTVAHNYCQDLRQREQRLAPVSEDLLLAQQANIPLEAIEETATENAYREHLFHILAHEIAHFPLKQQQALLSDLAARMTFRGKPSTLQAAFLTEGIRLEEYRQPPPESQQERRCQAALRSLAYKRLKRLATVQQYLAETC
jgi:hypothetical protein